MPNVYLPQVFGTGPTSQGGLSVEREVYALMVSHAEQGRVGMAWDDALADIAHSRVMSQARDGWSGHVDPQGRGPNAYCRMVGYQLPDWYLQDNDANNIESIADSGDGSVEGVWDSWLGSTGHRMHILATDSFYKAQTQVGIAYYYLATSKHLHYWCILSAPMVGE